MPSETRRWLCEFAELAACSTGTSSRADLFTGRERPAPVRGPYGAAVAQSPVRAEAVGGAGARALATGRAGDGLRVAAGRGAAHATLRTDGSRAPGRWRARSARNWTRWPTRPSWSSRSTASGYFSRRDDRQRARLLDRDGALGTRESARPGLATAACPASTRTCRSSRPTCSDYSSEYCSFSDSSPGCFTSRSAPRSWPAPKNSRCSRHDSWVASRCSGPLVGVARAEIGR